MECEERDMSTDGLDFDLDAKGLDVYEAIYEQGGEAETPDIKQYTGIEKNAIIHYRLDKMEEQGLVEIGTGEASGNRVPPRKATLTDKGRKLAEGGLWSDEEPTILDRLDRAERRMKVVEGAFQDLEDEFRRWKYDPEADEEVDLSDLLDRLDKFQAMTEGIDDDAMREAMDVVTEVEDLKTRIAVPRKHLGRMRSANRPGGNGSRILDGYDVVNIVLGLEAEIYDVAAALREEGIGPAEDAGHEEFLALSGGLWEEKDEFVPEEDV